MTLDWQSLAAATCVALAAIVVAIRAAPRALATIALSPRQSNCRRRRSPWLHSTKHPRPPPVAWKPIEYATVGGAAVDGNRDFGAHACGPIIARGTLGTHRGGSDVTSGSRRLPWRRRETMPACSGPQFDQQTIEVDFMAVRISKQLCRLVLVGLVFVVQVDLLAAADLFADKNLQTAIRDVLKKGEKDELKEEDLKNVFILKAAGKKITNLAGLEKCPNMALLNLANNQIKDLKPIAGLVNIQSLDLSNNQISDLAPVAKLVKLQYLKLDKNQVKSLEPLKDLTAMSALYLSENQVESIKQVSGLKKLSSLYLDKNQVQDVSPLKDLKWLSSLDLKHNKIKDVSPLAGLTELRYTFLEGNQIADVTPLVTMAKKDVDGPRRFAPYWHLYLAGNPLNAKAKSEQLAALKKLGVRVKAE